MAEPLIFETDRLILRAWDPVADADDAFRIYSDPEVVRYIGGESRRIQNPEEMRARLEGAARDRDDGLGRWAMRQKLDGRAVGTIILQHVQEGFGEPLEEIEIGWHLGREAWRRGYASEAARRLLRHGFETLDLREIIAVLIKENEASARVAQRIGMTRIGESDRYYGQTLEVYKITQAAYRALPSG